MPALLPRWPLFIPAHRPELLDKAAASGADAVLVDLEDAVAAAARPAARDGLPALASRARELGQPPLYVRINGWQTDDFDKDLTALKAAGIDQLMLAKSEDQAALDRIQDRLGGMATVILLIESALGLSRAEQLARHSIVKGLAFGPLDFALDVGCEPSWQPLQFARSQLVLAARLAGLAGPLDGPEADFKNLDQLQRQAELARQMGFSGKLAIHPAQLPALQAGFMPSPEEIARLEQIVAASGDGSAANLDGSMIDAPVVARAKQILAMLDRSETGREPGK